MYIDKELLNIIKIYYDCEFSYFCPQCGFKSMMFLHDIFECKNYFDCGLEIEFVGSHDELIEWQDNVAHSLKHGLLNFYMDCLHGHLRSTGKTH